MEVKEFFETYTETAAIVKLETEGFFPSGTNNAICFPCDDDHSIHFYLRNPKKYILEPRYTFNNSDISASSADMEFTQNSSDKSLVTLKFKQSFLQTQEETCNLEAKDLSGFVSFYEPMSGRVFDSYKINVHANTIPPAVLNPCFQLTSSSSSDAEYIVCFYLPKLAAINQIHKDTYNFYVNNEHLYINGASTSDFNIYQTRDDSGASVSYQNADTRFLSTAPTMTSLDDGFVFSASNCPAGYVPVYFMTGVAPTTDTTTYTFTISDDDGLSSSISISNKAKQLESPTFNVAADTVYSADEETYLYTLRINHSGLCTDGSSSGAVRINYTITERNHAHVFAAGSSDTLTQTGGSSVAVRLPKGEYDVTAIAIRDYYIASAPATVENFKVRTPAIFYVSETGEDNESRSASRSDPFRTVSYVFEQFTTGVGTGAYDADSICDVRLLTDLTPPEDWTSWTENDNSFIKTPGSGFTGAVKISGWGGVKTINANASSTDTNKRVIKAQSGSIEIKDIIITGGRTTGDGAGIYNTATLTLTNVSVNNNTLQYQNTDIHGGGICNEGTLTMTGGTIRGNKAILMPGSNNDIQGGGGLYNSGTATLKNVSITENKLNHGATAKQMGAGIYNEHSLTLDGCTVKENTSSFAAPNFGGGIYCDSGMDELILKGKNIITGNTTYDTTLSNVVSRNIILPYGEVITIGGRISGSSIGLYMVFTADTQRPKAGEPVTFTAYYNNYSSGIKPGVIFKCDGEYAVTESSGEAALGISSGTHYSAMDYNFSFAAEGLSAETGHTGTVIITPTITRNEVTGTSIPDITADVKIDGNPVTMVANLWNGGEKVGSDITPQVSAEGKLIINIPVLTFKDVYTLKLKVTYLDVVHTAEFNYVYDDPQSTSDPGPDYISLSAGETADYISTITSTKGIEVTGTITQEEIQEIAEQIKNLANGVNVNLDLSNVTGLTTLPEGLFSDNRHLEEIILPEGLTGIPSYTFWCCTSLTTVTIPSTVTSISRDAFYRVGADVTLAADNSAFKTVGNAIYTTDGKELVLYCNDQEENSSFTVPAEVEKIGDYAFCNAKIQTVTFEEGSQLTEIGLSAFDACHNLTAIHIPDSVTTIGRDAFAYDGYLATLHLPAALTEIKDSFTSIGVDTLIIPDNVTTIKSDAFYTCSMTTIVLPVSVTIIEDGAFMYCDDITTVNYKGSEAQKNSMSIGSNNGSLTTATWNFNYTGD